MYHDYFSNFARRNCAFFSDAVPVHRVVRAVEFKMATGCKFLSLAASLVDALRHVDSSVNLYTIFKPRYLEFPWFDFLHFWFLARQIYKLQICWRDPGDPPAVFQILAAEATNVNLTLLKWRRLFWK